MGKVSAPAIPDVFRSRRVNLGAARLSVLDERPQLFTCHTVLVARPIDAPVSRSLDGFATKAKVERAPGITPNYELKTIITLNQPFLEKSPHEGGKFNVASGMLLPKENGQYPLVLTYIDWGSEKDDSMGATKLMLTLGKPYGWGVAGGIVSLYTVTLSPVKPNPDR